MSLSFTSRQLGPSGLALLCLLPVLAVAPACNSVTAERIEALKSAPTGRAALQDILADEEVEVGLRAQAAGALVEMGSAEDMEATLAGLDLPGREALVPALVPGLASLAQAPDPQKAADARDALYTIRELVPREKARQAVDAVLFPALTEALRKGQGGAPDSRTRDILNGIGAEAVGLVMPLLQDPEVPLEVPIAVIEKVGKIEDQENAGRALVARAKQISDIPEDLWPALAKMGGKDAAAFLMTTVDEGSARDAERAAAAMATMRRTPDVASFAVKKAGSATTDPALRESLFAVAEAQKNKEAQDALLALIGRSLDAEVRHRAFAAVLKAGGGERLLEALEAFPRSARYEAETFRQNIVEPVRKMPGFDTRGPLFKAMDSKSALARLVAVLVIGEMGFPSDAQHLAKLEKDKGTVPGLPPADRVGRQASRMVDALEKKKKEKEKEAS